MTRKPRTSTTGKPPASGDASEASVNALRIIGGHFRGRKLRYGGDPRTRPMKDRVREAVFNLLGPAVEGKIVLDLFAGTGALGLEALSRGARQAIFFEQHFPTAAVIRENIVTLGVAETAEVIAANTFIQFRRFPGGTPDAKTDAPWLVFCSPPYDFYVDRAEDTLKLLTTIDAHAPARSMLVVEADARFDFALLPNSAAWEVREYPPARIAIRWDDASQAAEMAD